MPELTDFLEDLRCSACGTLDSLWLYPVRGVVECRECGSKATILSVYGGEA
ncbi:hypothetical protein Aple_065900 [Acrocarpospora pleiomorpha]|uniref:Uncharacterized protein n=1 Tax=Acrocarpospora pleiomorpha TaxID=90975 RepID=A0A5M3XVW4_9ACTN|nr:hypothetical protein [Acrocarpospora pleiomorpha]GES23691.1 hypothetical protein Aple_065900 [Acrocarpospora pleiomorpha]